MLKKVIPQLLFSIFAWSTAGAVWLFWRFYETTNQADYGTSFANIVVIWLIASVLFGTCYALINNLIDLNEKLQQSSYMLIVFIKTLGILFLGLGVIILVSFFAMQTRAITFGQAFISLISNNPVVPKFLVFTVYVSLIFNIVLQFQKMFGTKVSLQIALGYYRKPRQAECIFMFVDLNDFTTITEKFGHEHVAMLLQDCFAILEKSMAKHEGSIYSYVGDTAIVYWPKKEGLEKEHFLRAIFDFFRQIDKNKIMFVSKYGALPNFKAGIDIGEAIVKEIGVDKREILFLGDVLNTAARLVGLQNKLQLNPATDRVFVSEELIKHLNKMPLDLKTIHLGEINLKGKQAGKSIYLIRSMPVLNELSNVDYQINGKPLSD